jgi:hypothetical protein
VTNVHCSMRFSAKPKHNSHIFWKKGLQTSDLEHVFIAGSFFHYTGLFEPPECKDISPSPGLSDPLYIVKAKRKA